MDSDMRDLTSMLEEISTGPISKVRECVVSSKCSGRGGPPRASRGRGRGCSNRRSSLSSVVNPDTPSTLFPYIDAFPGFLYEFIQNWKNVIGDGNCGFRRHIDQNVLEKLTEMVKDEEVATWFVNGTCHKLINEIDEAENRRKLDGLKTKWQTKA
ncbi:hypothetical protein M9H77_13667 [Catharanthus roseus]|uniref:Uncharacterized protein n=1 Tax=Catharanthus roseus TaxID=4058 RepID=A0ACC0BL28_CATRO|nr:hypothetical protein M9H77_13667 [Catharanthus roseus]